MKRIALALAAAFLGTGCIVMDDNHDCDLRDVSVTWTGFTGPDAVRNRPCGTQVSYVDLYLNGQQVVGPLFNGHFACSDYGAIIVGVERGSYGLTVEGLASDETILFRDERSFSASGCGDYAITAEPAAGYVDLEYRFYAGTTQLPEGQQVCAGDYLWLSIYDATALGTAVLSDRTFDPTRFTCGGAFRLALASGPYTLEWMEERGPATTYALDSADCTDRPFTVPVAGATAVPVNLDVNAVTACVR